jgi:hypothetical protein
MKTKVKLEKYIRPKNITELIHHWANHLSPLGKEIKINGYEVYRKEDESLLYKHGTLIGLYNNDLKTFFVKAGIESGAFGNGKSTWDILRSISDKNNSLIVKKIPTDLILKNEVFYLEWIKNEFLYKYEHDLNKISYLKEHISNNRITCEAHIDYYTKKEFSDLYNLGNKRLFNKALKQVIKYDSKCQKYEGWSPTYTYYDKVPLEFTIKDYLEKGNRLFLTEDEIKVIEFKNWRYKYIKRDGKFIYNLENSKRFYEDLEKRNEIEESLKVFIADKEAKEERKRAEERKKDLKRHIETLKNIDLWRNNEIRSFNFPYYDVLRISKFNKFRRLYELDDNLPKEEIETVVETSRSARFKLKEAKMLYKLFKRCVENDTEFIPDKEIFVSGYRLIGIVKKPITILNIEKEEEEVVTTFIIRVGCHQCTASEIEAFVKYYKLDW